MAVDTSGPGRCLHTKPGHTYVSILSDAGTDIEQIAASAGHVNRLYRADLP